MRKFFVYFLCFVAVSAFGQSQMRRLPSIINHPSLNVYAPYTSLDGNAILFTSNNGQDGSLIVSYSARETDWSQPIEIPKTINTRLNYLRGYALSADGKKMFFTSAKSPGVGGYDIFVSELKGTTWLTPQNFAAPINSKTNDGCPSFTSDGNTIYFMRCDKMDMNTADGCKLFRAKKKSNGQWEEPVELPAHINTGNSQTPRIMADGETLIFSSNKNGGKGGMDLFMTRLSGDSWSQPTPLDFVNTDRDDQFVSVAALGRYLLKEAIGARKNSEITEFLIPNELRPKGMMKVEGKVTDPNGVPVPAYVAITSLTNNKRIFSGRPSSDGSYFAYLQEGNMYEMSIDPEQSHITFFSKRFDLTTDKIPQKEKVNVTLKPLALNDEILLSDITFKTASSDLETSSTNILKKLARLSKANPTLGFEIQVLLSGYEGDSVQSMPDLTEMIVDSVMTMVQKTEADTTVMVDELKIKTTYHNNRTEKQAQAIVEYLKTQGVNEANLIYVGRVVEAERPENKKLIVKAIARPK